jgi:hypothetical protein
MRLYVFCQFIGAMFLVGCSGTSTTHDTIPSSMVQPAAHTIATAATSKSAADSVRRPQTASPYYFVSVSGDDGNPGTAASPYRTIQRAINAATAGSTVIVGNGTYADCGNCTGVNYNVLFNHSGTSSAPITVEAQSPQGAVVDGGGYRRCMGFNNNLAYITIQGFHLQNCYGGIAGLGNAHDVAIKNNLIERVGLKGNCGTNGGAGFAGIGWQEAWNVTIDHNTIHDVGEPHNQYQCSYTNDHGIYGHGHDITITNNVFYNNNSGWDIQIAGGPTGQNWSIANNTFGARDDPRAPGNIIIWRASGPNTPSNVTIANNTSGLWIVTAFVDCIYGANTSNLIVRGNKIASSVGLLVGGCRASIANNTLAENPTFEPGSVALRAPEWVLSRS